MLGVKVLRLAVEELPMPPRLPLALVWPRFAHSPICLRTWFVFPLRISGAHGEPSLCPARL